MLTAFMRAGVTAVSCLLLSSSLLAQSVYDAVGEIPAGDPSFVDMNRVRVRQSTDKLQVEFYPVTGIPPGNQAGITTTTVFEVYLDVDSNASTGARLDDIGYDYLLRADLYQWNGKSWIDGNVYWGFDQTGRWSHSDAFCLSSAWLIPQRFRWEFSLVSLKWPRIDWVTRVYYRDHWAERVPDSSHATLVIDTSLVPDLDSAATEYIKIVYPETYQTVLDSFDVLHTVDQGAKIESALCGTDFETKPLCVTFSPWLNGVAYSGNPVKMGSWNWGSTPAWFIYFHELGHNFTLAATRFRKLYPGGGYVPAGGDDWHYGTNFVEAWATLAGLYASHELTTKPAQYSITSTAKQDLESQTNGTITSYRNALLTYEAYPDHSRLYPDLVDGIFLALADSLGYDIIPRWYKMLQPPDSAWSRLEGIDPTANYDDAKIRSLTITAAAFSVSGYTDLEELFRQRWDFPVDHVLYAELIPELTAMIGGAAAAEDEWSAGTPTFKLLGNYPNPFNGSTSICFVLSKRSLVEIKVYNTLGQLVRTVTAGTFMPGRHTVPYEGEGLPSGVYCYTLTTAEGKVSDKMVLVK